MTSKPRAMPQLPQDRHQDQGPQHTGEAHLAHILSTRLASPVHSSIHPRLSLTIRVLCLLTGGFSPVGLSTFKHGACT